MTSQHPADVAELADAQVSEACDGDIVEVQVLSSAPSEPSSDYIDLPCNLWMVFSCKIFCHGFSEAGVLVLTGPVPKGEYLMNVDQAALMETDNLRTSGVSQLPERAVRLKLAERPDRDRIQRVVDLADALLSEAETLARDKAFTEEATRLKPLDIL